MPEAMKLIGSTNIIIDKAKNGEKYQSLSGWGNFSTMQFSRQSILTKFWGTIYLYTQFFFYYLLNIDSGVVFSKKYHTVFDNIIIIFID